MAANPNPARITDELWYLWEQLHALEPDTQLGGIYAFKPGYHSTRRDNQANWPGNYSIVDTVDQGGPSDKAGAIDWTFPEAHGASYERIDKYSSRLLASGKDPDDHRLDGWREFYGQCDADTHVEGYDFRYAQTATSDPSHLWHIHLSCDRDKVTSRANMDNLLSVLRGEPNMPDTEEIVNGVWHMDGEPAINNQYFPWRTDSPAHVPPPAKPNLWITAGSAVIEMANRANLAYEQGKANAEALARIESLLASGVPIPGQVSLTPESVAAVADATADELRADPERDGV